MPIPASKLRQLIDCMDALMVRLDRLDKRRARNDADEDRDEEGQFTDPLDAPQQPFSDGVRDEKSPPQPIHGIPEF